MIRTSREVQRELDRLLREYEAQVESVRAEGLIARTTANTYLLHASNSVRWNRGVAGWPRPPSYFSAPTSPSAIARTAQGRTGLTN